MKVVAEKNVLLNGIQVVHNIITSKSALPILSNILLETQQNKLKLTATDLDVGISCVIPVETQEQGAITIPAKRFSDIIKELPSDKVTIVTKKNNLITIDAEPCQFKIMGLAREEFPKLPEFKDGEAIRIEQATLKRMLELTSFAVSVDETRYIFNGILFKTEKQILTLVATDGKRLASIEKEIVLESNKNISIIIPVKTIHELNRNLQEEGEVSIILGNNQVLFDLGGVVIISRLIEGEFPDYRQVIPPVASDKVRVNRERFLLAIRRAALLSTPDYQAVKIELFKNKAVISKTTPDVGESREEVNVEYSGKELIIGFNPYYLIDVLKNLSDEIIALEVTDSQGAGVIRTAGYIYVVLPMRLS
ncbi:MAG: DNA polymerase III subunit beta [Candidatus Omnitrophica bacterium]|nr:DNA polymerase III subunit beta [Candidatus Omnitrophota bacterium]